MYTTVYAHAETRSTRLLGARVTGLLQDTTLLLGAEIFVPHKNHTANATIFELSFQPLNLLFPVLQSA